MARFLAVHEMFDEAQSLIGLVVSRKGKNSASSVFIALVEMRGASMCYLGSISFLFRFVVVILDAGFPSNVYVFNVLMNKYCKEGKVCDAQKVFDEQVL
ncbi:hypothetical protein AALP_AA1G101700 [Arabis alpina]|uniref:Pentatricopeptide repeat-containing protein n=1 Tax=Arabis alpina TaxID=50452 RepID=A0A087HMB4_ARAAL|nr:hypothetical protein AALP_AA1G101700 [Arabis alpina]